MAGYEDHQKSELELFRREIVNKDGMIEILQNNIRELQEQLQNSYKRIEELNNEKHKFTGNNDDDVGYYPGHS